MTIATQIQALNDGLLDAYDAVSTKGGTVPAAKNLDNLPTAISSVPAGGSGKLREKDVNFYDYDGTLLYAYDDDEFLALDSLPANPDRTADNLTADGWNWSLAGAKAAVTEHGGLDIGQVYHPADGKGHVFIRINGIRKIRLNCGLNGIGGMVIDWGDGNSEVLTTIDTEHEYAADGDYDISFSRPTDIPYASGQAYVGGSGHYDGSGTLLITNPTSESASDYYRDCVRKVYFCDGLLTVGNYALAGCHGLESVVWDTYANFRSSACLRCYSLKVFIHPTCYYYQGYTFQECYSLKALCYPELPVGTAATVGRNSLEGTYNLRRVIIPSYAGGAQDFCRAHSLEKVSLGATSTTFGSYDQCFTACYVLKDVKLPNGIQTLYSTFNGCFNLEKITLPSTITALNGGVFYSCYSLREIDLSNVSVVPSRDNPSNTFYEVPKGFVIKVPASLLSQFQTEWSDVADSLVGV